MRWCVFLAVALGLHLAFYGALGARSRPRTDGESVPTDETAVTVVTAEPDERPRPAPPPEERPLEATSARVRRGAAASSPTSRAGAPGGVTARVESAQAWSAPSSRESPPASDDRGWSLPVPGMGDVTSREFIARALPRPSAGLGGSGGLPQTGGITEALDAHDTALGLTRAGPLLAVLENVVGGAAPFEGTATFDVGVDTDGNVYATVLDASGDAEGWSQVASATRAAVDPKRVRIPPHARGWHAIMKVEAKVQYPNGLDPKKLGTDFKASPTAVTFTSVGKICSVRITLGLTLVPILGGCDPSNIGAHPLRVVHGSIVSEGRF